MDKISCAVMHNLALDNKVRKRNAKILTIVLAHEPIVIFIILLITYT